MIEKTSEQYRIYDSIVGNMLEQIQDIQHLYHTKKNIIFYNKDEKIMSDVVLKMCFMCEDIFQSFTYIDASILTYFKLKIKYFHKRKIKWANIRKLNPIIWPTTICYNACEKFKQPYTIIEELYEEYYS